MGAFVLCVHEEDVGERETAGEACEIGGDVLSGLEVDGGVCGGVEGGEGGREGWRKRPNKEILAKSR